MQESLQNYLANLTKISKSSNYEKPESFINLPFDENNVSKVMQTAEKITTKGKIKEVVVIGIGGSSTGAKAVYEALSKEHGQKTRLHFLDQINLKKIYQVSNRFHKLTSDEGLIIFISKSGKTLETLKNYELLKNALNKKFPVILITGGSVNSSLEKEADHVLKMPEKVGGRFSVFSAVGLFPLAIANINVLEFLKGGMAARKECLKTKGNTATKKAEKVFKNYQEGKKIFNIFVFSPELKALAYWYQQLLGESLGKEGKGLFPTITEGSKDLHSLQQYFTQGKQNVQHEFIISKEENKFQKTILKAVQKTYQEAKIPFQITEVEQINPNSLGRFMEEKMFKTLFLAELMEVNPFGQPGVESYKKKIKNL